MPTRSYSYFSCTLLAAASPPTHGNDTTHPKYASDHGQARPACNWESSRVHAQRHGVGHRFILAIVEGGHVRSGILRLQVRQAQLLIELIREGRLHVAAFRRERPGEVAVVRAA